MGLSTARRDLGYAPPSMWAQTRTNRPGEIREVYFSTGDRSAAQPLGIGPVEKHNPNILCLSTTPGISARFCSTRRSRSFGDLHPSKAATCARGVHRVLMRLPLRSTLQPRYHNTSSKRRATRLKGRSPADLRFPSLADTAPAILDIKVPAYLCRRRRPRPRIKTRCAFVRREAAQLR